jgi:hypothetical protein
MRRWFKRARRSRVINADAEKFHKSFELLRKYQAVPQAQDGDCVNHNVKAAVEAGEDLERFITELLERQSCQ